MKSNTIKKETRTIGRKGKKKVVAATVNDAMVGACQAWFIACDESPKGISRTAKKRRKRKPQGLIKSGSSFNFTLGPSIDGALIGSISKVVAYCYREQSTWSTIHQERHHPEHWWNSWKDSSLIHPTDPFKTATRGARPDVKLVQDHRSAASSCQSTQREINRPPSSSSCDF